MSASGVGIRLQDVQVSFGSFVAVDGINLQVEPGESFGIVGESGSGKSTLLRALCGLVPMARGSMTLFQAQGQAALPALGKMRSSQ